MAKKTISLLLVVLLALGMAACSPSSAPTASDPPAATPENTAAASPDGVETPDAAPATSAYEKKLTISMDVLDAEKNNVTAKDAWFREKFNIEWELYPVTWGDWMEKVRAWVAADDMPDILWWDMKCTNTAEFRVWAEAGAFREIPADLSAWPELAALRDTITSDEMFLTVNDKLYGWPSSRKNPEWLDNAYYSMFAYRRDWAKAVGMYKEGDMYTWDEVKAMIEAVRQQAPGGNGAGNTIGIVSEAWAFPGVFMEVGASQAERYAYSKNAEGKYELYAFTDGFLNELKFVTDLYQNGYIWKDQVVDSGSDGVNQFFGGKAFMMLGSLGPGWFTGTAYPKMVNTGVCGKEDVAPMIVFSPADDKSFYLIQTEDYWTVAHINHKVDDEKFTRILDMWNWLASEEGRIFRVAGLEGKDYEKNGDGTYNILWEKNEDGSFISPYADASFNIYQPPCSTGSPNEVSDMDGWKAYEPIFEFMQTSENYKAEPKPWEVMAFGGELYSTYGYFESDVNAKVTEIVVGGGDVEAQWNAFKAELAPKVQPVVDEINAALT